MNCSYLARKMQAALTQATMALCRATTGSGLGPSSVRKNKSICVRAAAVPTSRRSLLESGAALLLGSSLLAGARGDWFWDHLLSVAATNVDWLHRSAPFGSNTAEVSDS